jgi:hypothetical protein
MLAHAADLVEVHYDPDGPPTFLMAVARDDGEVEPLERDHPTVTAIEERAFAEALKAEPRPLPRGSFHVLVGRDEYGQMPSDDELAARVAAAVLAA